MHTVTTSEQLRLIQRAQRIANLRHPNLVRMLPMPGGAGLTPLAKQGRRLSDFTPAGTFKRFELRHVARLLLDVLSGLSALHEDVEDGVGFVHGGVAPQHIWVGDDGTARLVPLLSRHWMPEAPPLANGYAAPEFLISARIDHRADLFSVGVMLGEALTGKPLFPDPALDAVLARLLGGKLLPLVPTAENAWARPLCAIAERAISPYPELRFQSAIELSNAIGAAVGQRLAADSPDGWQAEAPTLVQVPRPRAGGLRTLTPFASVLDLEPALDSVTRAAMPPRSLEAPVASLWSKARGRVTFLALGAAALAALGLGLLAPRHSRPTDALSAKQPDAAAEALPVPTALARRSSSEVPRVPASAPSTTAPIPTWSTSAQPSPPKQRARGSRRPAHPEDYGI